MLKLLYVAPLGYGSTSRGFYEAFQSLDVDIQAVNLNDYQARNSSVQAKLRYKLRSHRPRWQDIAKLNDAVIQAAHEQEPDLLFFFPLSYVLPETLKATRQYGLNFAFFVDDMFNRANQTFNFVESIKHTDCILTTKSYNVPEFEAAGAPLVLFVNNSYAPSCHYPVTLTGDDCRQFGGDIAFVGTFRPERADFLGQLIRSLPPTTRFNIWGGGWNKMQRPIYWRKRARWSMWRQLQQCIRGSEVWCEDMSRVFRANKINLGLLNRANRDVQTTRTVEIPACGGFLLAERTDEQRALFEEGREAAYFGSFDELVDKIRYYLAHDDERQRIAQAGYERCMASDYSYIDRARFILEQFDKLSGKRLHTTNHNTGKL